MHGNCSIAYFFLGRFGRIVLSTLLVCALVFLAVPCAAWAKYTDVSAQYPAARDLYDSASSGLQVIGQSMYQGVVSADSIVSGTYTVPVFTSSRMCNLYATKENATLKTSPNQAVLHVSGGTATLTFYLSGAYTALYLGTAQDAASHASSDGMTPSSAYLSDGNNSNDTGHGPFSVGIGSLNTDFTFAVFNGGSRGVSAGMWYERIGAVIATDEFVNSSVIGKSDSQEKPDSGSSSNSGSGSDRSDGSGSAALGSKTKAKEEAKTKSAAKKNATKSSKSENNSSPENSNARSQEGSFSESNSEEEESNDEVLGVDSSSNGSRWGSLITIAGAQEEGEESQNMLQQGSLLQLDGLTPEQIVAMLLAACILVGAALFFFGFRFQMRRKSSLTNPLSKEHEIVR